MRRVQTSLIVASLCLLDTATAQTEIHKCTDADGGIVYSQLPCGPQKPLEPGKTEPAETAAIAESVAAERDLPVTENLKGQPEAEADREVCRKRYREAIDVIDAEIGREYSPEKADQYKQRLLVLTRQLRKC
jgi:hypothetical protein